MFGQEVREDRAGWMDGPAANLGNRQMAAVLIPGIHLSGCAVHCCMPNLAIVAHVIICMYVQYVYKFYGQVVICVSGKKIPMTCVLM